MVPINLPLSSRKILCGRLLVVEALLAHEDQIDLEDATAKAPIFRDAINRYFEAESSKDGEQRENENKAGQGRSPLKALDQSLLDAISNFKLAAGGLNLDSPPVLQQLLTAIEKSASSISCANCSSTGICEGISESDDDEIVARGGLCLAPFRQLFEVAREIATTYYEAYCGLLSAATTPQIILSTWNFENAVNADETIADGAAGAKTVFSSRNATAEIQLQFAVKRFSRRAFKGMLYLLLHECIAHAFHGLFPDPKNRIGTEPYDRFAEGWMDWVSYYILRQVIEGSGFAGDRWRAGIILPDILGTTQQMHEARHDASNESGSLDERKVKGLGQIRLGVSVAKKTYAFIKKLCIDHEDLPSDYDAAFLRLSLELNMLGETSAEDTNMFIDAMRKLSFPPESDARWYFIEEKLLDYLRGGSIDSFIQGLRTVMTTPPLATK